MEYMAKKQFSLAKMAYKKGVTPHLAFQQMNAAMPPCRPGMKLRTESPLRAWLMRQRDTAAGDRGDNYPVQRCTGCAAPHTNMMNAAADNNRVSCEMTIHQITKH